MAEDINDHRTMIYSLQNETIASLYNAQKEAKNTVTEINSYLGSIIPSSRRESLYLFPFTGSVNLTRPISAIKDIFLNQIIQIESENYPDISIDYNSVMGFIEKQETYDAFRIAEHIKKEYLQNDEHILRRIKSDCRRLIPVNGFSPSEDAEKKNKTAIKLKALNNPERSLCCLESLGKLVDITFNSTAPSKAKGITVYPGESHIDERMRLYYFKNGNVRLIFNNPENTEKMINALEMTY